MKALLSFLLILLVFSVSVQAQALIITTCAGNGMAGYSGDGGPATAAKLNSPAMVITDASGNLYFSDIGNDVVRKVNSAGIITTIAGIVDSPGYSGDGGTATAAKFNSPLGVARDNAGNLYIADEENSVIRKVNTTGIISTIAGTTVQGFAGDGGPATAAQLNQPSGLAIDRNGNLIIADEFNSAIRKLDLTTGRLTTIVGMLGSPGYTGNGGPATAAKIGDVVGINVNSRGALYITESFTQHIVRKIDTFGIITLAAGDDSAAYTGDGMPATATKIDAPGAVVIDDTGNVYFSCQLTNVVRKVNTAGILSTYAGKYVAGYSGDGGAPDSAKLSNPLGMAIDNAGNMYIAELDNNRIRKIGLSTLGIPDISTFHTNIYPNPAETVLNIMASPGPSEGGEMIRSVIITNILGQTVYVNNYNTEKVSVDVSGLPAGIYFVKVQFGCAHCDNQIEVRKFVKE